MHPFSDLAAVEEVLQELMARETPLITLIPRQPGQKEGRYAQLFSGIPVNNEGSSEARPEPARQRVMAENERIAKLEADVTSLHEEVADLRRVINEFKKQFE